MRCREHRRSPGCRTRASGLRRREEVLGRFYALALGLILVLAILWVAAHLGWKGDSPQYPDDVEEVQAKYEEMEW